MSDDWIKSWINEGSLIELCDGRILIGFNLFGKMKKSEGNSLKKLSKFDSESYPKFYVTNFFLDQSVNHQSNSWVIYEDYKVFTKEELYKILLSFKETFISGCQESRLWINSHEKIFKDQFEELKNKLLSDKLVKAVPYVFEESIGKASKEEILKMLIHALEYVLSHPAYIYGSWNENGGILGATPEILFRDNHGILETMACAGTESKNVLKSDFLNDPKQRLEHQVVVDSLVASLSPYGNVTIGKCDVLELPTLNHLVTALSLKYKDQISQKLTIEELVRLLHPTPALGAYPKKEGSEWLKTYEHKIPRKRFGAPFGVSFNGENVVYVAIRNVQWDLSKMFIGAGVGVVKSSRYDQEHLEIQLKLKAIKQVLGL